MMVRIERQDKIRIGVIFSLSFLFYAVLTTRFDLPTFLASDESIWVGLAKSFHFNHNFQYRYLYQSYDCTLYSIIISIAYFFTGSGHILTGMRLIGAALMSTACIPAYLLALKAVSSRRMATAVGILTVLVPELLYSGFMTQEVLFYPLVLWLFYTLFQIVEKKNESRFCYEWLGVLFFLVYWTKTYAIVFLLSYVVLEGIWLLLQRHEWKQQGLKLLRVLFCFFVLFIINKLLIAALNGFHPGEMHYSGQISRIPKLNLETMLLLVKGGVLYLLGVLISFGMFPVCTVFGHAATQKNARYVQYLILVTLAIIGETTISIYLVENAEPSSQYRIHMRYYFPLLIPYVISMIQILREKMSRRTAFTVAGGLIFSNFLFFSYFDVFLKRWAQSVIDAMTLNVIRSIQEKDTDFYRFLLMLFVGATIGTIGLLLKQKYRRLSILWVGALTLVFASMIPLNYQLSTSTYAGLDTKAYEKKSITTAKELDDYDYVIYVQDNRRANNIIDINWGNCLNLYSKKEVRTIESSSLQGFQVEQENTCFLIPVSLGVEIAGAEKKDSANQLVEQYVMNQGVVELVQKKERELVLESLSYRNAKLENEGLKLEPEGEIFGPYWELEEGSYSFIIYGNQLNQLQIELYSWKEETAEYFELLDQNRSDTVFEFRIQLTEKKKDFELHLYDKEGGVEISQILIRRVE